MPFCHHCGKEVQSDAFFCSSCGTRQHVPVEKAAPAVTVAPAAPPTPTAAPVPVATQDAVTAPAPTLDAAPTAATATPPQYPPTGSLPEAAVSRPADEQRKPPHELPRAPADEPRIELEEAQPIEDEVEERSADGGNRRLIAAIGASAFVLGLLVCSLVARIISDNTPPAPAELPGVAFARQNAASSNDAEANPAAGTGDIPLDTESALCQSNLRQIALSLQQYAQDNDRRYPPAKAVAAGEVGWADSIQPYLKSTPVLRCPLMPTSLSGSPSDIGYTDYYYNHGFENHLTSDLNFPANTIMLGDGAPADARYSRTETEILGTPPANTRHQSGANYAFADGHVKWLSPDMAKPASVPVSTMVFSHNVG